MQRVIVGRWADFLGLIREFKHAEDTTLWKVSLCVQQTFELGLTVHNLTLSFVPGGYAQSENAYSVLDYKYKKDGCSN